MQSRLLTIGIRKYIVTQPRTKRHRKTIAFIKDRIAHYTKTKLENVRISQALNELVFKKYAKSLAPVKVTISFENDIATATPFVEKKVEEKKPAAKAEVAKGAAEAKK